MYTNFRLWAGIALAGTLAVFSLFGQEDRVARGKYLVENVARCQDCHTPRLLTGEYVRSAWLKGTTLAFAPVNPTPGWHPKTPDITSTSILWSRWGEEGMVTFFETGKNPRGDAADPPMPAYNLNHEDALAVVAYLKSLQ